MVERKMSEMIRNQLENLEMEMLFKPISEVEDIKRYIEKGKNRNETICYENG